MSRALSEPYLHVRREGAAYRVAGTTLFFRGHRLDHGSVEEPEGLYVEWAWDGERLCARTCRYGGYPVYYFAGEGEFGISPSIATLLALGAPRHWDEAALAVLLRFRICVGEDTPFKAIRLLPANSTLIWKDGHLEIEGRRKQLKASTLHRDEVIDAYIAAVRGAVARRQPTPGTVFPLSGGRDSRHILLELCHQGLAPPVAVTAHHPPPRPDDDPRIAGILAARLGIRHVEMPLAHARVAAEREKNRRTSFTVMDHAWFLQVAAYANANADTVYDGLGGDTYAEVPAWNDRVAQFYEKGNMRGLATHLLGRMVYPMASEWGLNGILTPKWRRALSFEVAVDRLSRELAKHLGAPHPLTSFQFASRGRRGNALAPMCLYAPHVRLFTPYLDHAVLDLAEALPPAITADHNLHTDVIHRAYPAYRDIPFDSRQAVIASPRNYVRRLGFDLLSLLARRPKSAVTRAGWVTPRLVDLLLRDDIQSVRRLGLVPFILLRQLEEVTAQPDAARSLAEDS